MSEKGKSWNAGNLGLAPRLVRHHPSEVMLRALFSKRYCSLAPDIGNSTRVLDIGAMYLNNLVPFHDPGLEIERAPFLIQRVVDQRPHPGQRRPRLARDLE